jgi:hypothetical protein
MITSAPDAISLHEKSIDEMWGRALKGQAASACLRHLLDRDVRPVNTDELLKLKGIGRTRRRKSKS